MLSDPYKYQPQTTMPIQRYIVRFTGHVQGVGFRVTCRQEAMGLNVHGHVCNNIDGSVTLDIDASDADAKELIRRIQANRKDHIEDTQIETSESQDRTGQIHIR